MIRKTDAAAVGEPQLCSQYLTVMEVGGSYAHRFFDLLAFLELCALIITDIDAVKPNAQGKRLAVHVEEVQFTSNGCIKAWFDNALSPAVLLAKAPVAKDVGGSRMASQNRRQDMVGKSGQV